jgi:hypothetical protein
MSKTTRVRCTQDNFYPAGPATITVGKEYDAIESADGEAWLITNDFDVPDCYMLKSRFEVVAPEPVPSRCRKCKEELMPFEELEYDLLCEDCNADTHGMTTEEVDAWCREPKIRDS